MNDRASSDTGRNRFLQRLAFPVGVGIIYGTIATVRPEQTIAALKASVRVLLQIAPALVIAFGMIVFLNWIVRPAQVRRFLGEGAEVKGAVLSVAAGILSMGPIYAWYPLLQTLREKNVSPFHLATFLGCRAVKLPLVPIMAAYFGWAFTVVLSSMVVLGSLMTGVVVQMINNSAAVDN